MQHDENNFNINTSIYNGEPLGSPEQEAAKRAEQRARRARLPKFTLPEGEEFYIPRDKIAQLNTTYFEMLNNMQKGFNVTPEDMRSYIESVVFAAYVADINNMQREAAIEGEHKLEVYYEKRQMLTPGYVRKFRFFGKKKPNYVQQLFSREAELESEIELSKYRDDIEEQKEFLYGDQEEVTPQKKAEEILNAIIADLPPRKREKFKKKNHALIVTMLTGFMQKPVKPVQRRTEAIPEDEPQDPEAQDKELEAVEEELEAVEDEFAELYELEEELDEDQAEDPEADNVLDEDGPAEDEESQEEEIPEEEDELEELETVESEPEEPEEVEPEDNSTD